VPDLPDADHKQEETVEDPAPRKAPLTASKPERHRGWFRRTLAWLRNWRTLAGLVTGSLPGFMVGVLAFLTPWHLKPDLGDVPTWLLTFLGLMAGVVGLAQLGMLQDQGKEEHHLNVRRHELFKKQIDEADRRKNHDERRQAESVELRFRALNNQMFPIVVNNSNRPISHVSCR
jgi:hypothetical protein